MPGNKNPLLTTFSDLSMLLDRFLLSDSVHVSLSWALPQAFASWTILSLVALVGTDSYNSSVTYLFLQEPTRGSPVPSHRLSLL